MFPKMCIISKHTFLLNLTVACMNLTRFILYSVKVSSHCKSFLLTVAFVVRGDSIHFVRWLLGQSHWEPCDMGGGSVSRTPLLAWDAVSLKVCESVCAWLCIKTAVRVLRVKSLIALLAHSWNSFQWKQSHRWSRCVSRVWPANPWIRLDSQL